MRAAQFDDVFVGGEPDVVANAHGGHEHAEFECRLLAQQSDALEQVAALRLIHERDERVADLELDGIDLQQVLHRARGRRNRRCLLHFGGGLRVAIGVRPIREPRERCECAGEREERNRRQAGHEAERGEHAGGDVHRPRLRAELRREHGTDARTACGVRDHEAGGRGDDQRGDLRDESLADGEYRVRGRRLRKWQAALHDTDEHAADDIDAGDEHAGDRIALHEFRGAVHRAVEVGLLRDDRAALAGGGLVDEAGVQVGVDRHLLAGHRVEREARGDLGHAAGALRDDDEVDADEDQEQDETYGVVAADDELSKCFDHLARASLREDEARGTDVQREPEQREQEEEGGERAELEWVARVERDEQHDERDADRERQEHVQHDRRQRHQHAGTRQRHGFDRRSGHWLVQPLPGPGCRCRR